MVDVRLLWRNCFTQAAQGRCLFTSITLQITANPHSI